MGLAALGCSTTNTSSAGVQEQETTAQHKEAPAGQSSENPAPELPEVLTEKDFGKVSYALAEKGLMACFEKGTYRTDKVDDDGNPVLAYCEVSAAVALPHEIYFASDKEIPGEKRSSVFSVRRPDRAVEGEAAPYVDVSSMTHFPNLYINIFAKQKISL